MRTRHCSVNWLIGLLAFILCMTLPAAEDHDHDHDLFEVNNDRIAHQHGLAHAQVSLQEHILRVTLIVAANDVPGLQSDSIEDALQPLEQVDQLFKLTPDCIVTSVPSNELLKDTIVQSDSKHKDITADYQWSCFKQLPTEMEFKLFKLFPNIETVNVQFVFDQLQRTALVTTNNRRFPLAP